MPRRESYEILSTRKKIISLLVLVLSDFFVVVCSFCLAYFIRDAIIPRFMERLLEFPLMPFTNFLKLSYFGVFWIFIFAYEGLYTKRYALWEEIKILLKSTTIASLAIMVMIFIARKQGDISRIVVVLAWLLSLALFPLARYLAKLFLVKSNLWKKKLIILGVQDSSLNVLKNIHNNKTMGYEVMGFLDDDPQKVGKTYHGVKVIGRISQLEEMTQAYGSKDIILAISHLPQQQLQKLLDMCESLSDSMWLIPRSGDFISGSVEIEFIGDVLSLYIKKNLAKPWNIAIKTAFEMALTIILTILLLPVFLIIILAIKLESKGSAIFIQERIGHKKRTFKLFKFRSMYLDNEEKLRAFLNTNPAAKEEWSRFKKLKNHDPRVTKVGKFIRKYSLDELPQLFNILRGNMSLVGPRPYLPDELNGKETFKDRIAPVKPGITGLWQISGRSELPFEKRISLDELYIRNWSLWLDLTILLKSVRVWLLQKGAY